MLTAERLFGQHGIEGTSLRQIVQAAGHGNNSAVQHHFGTKEGLVQAVFEMRLPELEKARWRRLVTADHTGKVGYRELLEALFMPVLDVISERERESFVLFTWRLMLMDPAEHPFSRAQDNKASATVEITRRLQECFPHLASDVFNLRFRLAMNVFLSALTEWRFHKRRRGSYTTIEDFWRDVIKVAAAVLDTPFSPSTQLEDKAADGVRRSSLTSTRAKRHKKS